MNVLDVIKECILNPCFTKNYDIEMTESNEQLEACSAMSDSVFTEFTEFKRENVKADSVDQKLLKLYMKVWTGLGRLLAKTITQGNCFISLELGYFYPLKDRFVYSPTLELMNKYGYLLIEDFCNISPKNRTVNPNHKL